MSKRRIIFKFKRLLPSKTHILRFIFKKPVRFFSVRPPCKAKSPKNSLSLGIEAGRALMALGSHRQRRVVVEHLSRRKSKKPLTYTNKRAVNNKVSKVELQQLASLPLS